MLNEEYAALDSSDSDSDLEDVLLLEVFNRHNNVNRAEMYGAFNLNNLSETECKLYFRFEQDDIPRLAQALRVPNDLTTGSGHRCSGIEGLCILLRRLSYPNRLSELEYLFGKSAPALSKIIDYMLNHIYNNFGHKLSNLRNLHWLNLDRFQLYANAISQKGAPIPNWWAFIDGTARSICKPSENQEAYYSGHKRHHCVKYQALTCPDGMIVSLKGGYEGRKHDAAILRESQLYYQLERSARFPNGENFIIYGDKAYGIRELLLTPFANRAGMTPEQQEFNARMSEVRIAVE